MYKNKTIAVVVPAFNEERFIGEVIRTMPEFVDRVYIVNDCSLDNTLTICNAFNEPRLRIINHKKRSGPGAAMLTGYKKACEEKMDIAAIMAGDGQMDPNILDKIIDPIISDKADYTKGDRLSIKANRQGMPFFRLFGNRLLTFIIGIASGYTHVSDPLNGFCAITRETLMKLDLDHIEPGYAFETDLLIKLGAIGAKVVNVKMPARYRGEKSKMAYFKFMVHTSWVIIRDFLLRVRKSKKKKAQLQRTRADVREGESC